MPAPEIPSLPVQGAYIADKKAAIKGALELGNVDNTADADKPVSDLTQAALDLKADITALTNGLAAKSDSDHTHPIEDVLLLTEALAGKIGSDTTLAGGGTAITNMVVISETDYNDLAEPDADTVYLIIEDPAP